MKNKISFETQLTLHFQNMCALENTHSLALRPQSARLDFIQFCLSQGKKLSDSRFAFDAYVTHHKSTENVLESIQSLSPEELNRKKLSLLFAHLSAFNYNLEGLTIEAVALADLIQKIQNINRLPEEELAKYLDKLIGKKIPGYESMSIESFLSKIEDCYKEDGVNFHCYLRENFATELSVKAVKKAEPSLNYFMPTVFCQQHLNTCSIASTMSMLKKVVTNFNQMQAVCFSDQELPGELLHSQKKIKALELKFDEYLKNPSHFKKNHVQKLAHDYLKEIEIIQIELEKVLAKRKSPTIQLFIKRMGNFILALMGHLVTTRITPKGATADIEQILKDDKLTSFQKSSLIMHQEIIPKEDLMRLLHKENATFRDKTAFLKIISHLFLYGKSKTKSESMVSGHVLVIDIDGSGNLNLIEHKNAKPVKTILSTNSLLPIGISRVDPKEKNTSTLTSIRKSLDYLYMERQNMVQIQQATLGDPVTSAEINALLMEKQAEIKDLLDIVNDLQGTARPDFFKIKQFVKQIPDDSDHQVIQFNDL